MTRSEQIISKVIGPDVLDVGCAGHTPKPGSAYWLHGMLLARFPSATGIDLNAANVERLRDSGYSNIFVADAQNFSLESKFDTIVAGELIEHLSNPGSFLECCQAHLKSGGRLVLSTPYVYSLLYILYAFTKYPNTCQNDEHAMWYCPKTLRELASRYGFRVEQWQLIEDYEFDNPSMRYRLFAWLVTTLGRALLPGRLRMNSMLFVLYAMNGPSGSNG